MEKTNAEEYRNHLESHGEYCQYLLTPPRVSISGRIQQRFEYI